VRARVLVRGLALEVADLRREEAQVVAGEREVALAPELVGGPGLERLEVRQLVRVAIEQVAQAVDDRDPLAEGKPMPAAVAEGGAGGGDRSIDIRRRPIGHASDELSRRGAADLDPATAR